MSDYLVFMSNSVKVDEDTIDRYSTKRKRYLMKLKLVNFLKNRRLNHKFSPVDFRLMMIECNLDSLEPPVRKWLYQVALPQDKRVQFVPPIHFNYKPVYDIRTKDDFVRLLRDRNRLGLGVTLKDLELSLPDVKIILKETKSYYRTVIRRGRYPAITYFYKPTPKEDHDTAIMHRMYKQIDVSRLRDRHIEAYLKKNGIKPFMASNYDKMIK